MSVSINNIFNYSRPLPEPFDTISNKKIKVSSIYGDGVAVMMALMPFLQADDEFQENLEQYYDQFNSGYPDMAKATECMAMLCDNAYRRIKDPGCSAHLKVGVDKSGNLVRVSQTHLDSGAFAPA